MMLALRPLTRSLDVAIEVPAGGSTVVVGRAAGDEAASDGDATSVALLTSPEAPLNGRAQALNVTVFLTGVTAPRQLAGSA